VHFVSLSVANVIDNAWNEQYKVYKEYAKSSRIRVLRRLVWHFKTSPNFSGLFLSVKHRVALHLLVLLVQTLPAHIASDLYVHPVCRVPVYHATRHTYTDPPRQVNKRGTVNSRPICMKYTQFRCVCLTSSFVHKNKIHTN
jgi:hypothetical protein